MQNKTSTLEELRKSSSMYDLARLLGYKPKALSYILYHIPDDKKYTVFTIPKKNGTTREIKAPISQLKALQRRLTNVLEDCIAEIESGKKFKSISHGFKKGHSIVTNASRHKNRRYVFNLDLVDFFPSINFGRVRGFFIKSNDFRLNEKVATLIAQICCYQNELPQGSPSSPIISNLVGHLMDVRLVDLAKKHKCNYSRYADDLTFSTNHKSFPNLIAYKPIENTTYWVASDRLEEEISKAGFKINKSKTRMQYNLSRQIVTGLVVNKGVNIKAEYYRYVRSMCSSLFKNGIFYLSTIKENQNKEQGTENQLEGFLSHVYYIKNLKDYRAEKEKKLEPLAITKLYSKYLFYKYFYNIEQPVIICEGKTDNIYLKCALRMLYPSYNQLVTKLEDRFKFNIKFFNYTKSSSTILHLSGGTGDLVKLIYEYKKRIKNYSYPGKRYPVIIIIDNDSGAKNVFNAIKNINKLNGNLDKNASFYHIVDNLYVIATPRTPENQETKIEDFFDKRIWNIQVEHKTFNPDEKTFKADKNYGKFVFAEKVIAQNYTKINFEKFKLILDRISEVIKDYDIKKRT